jgi:hypothetical protein
MDNSNTKWVVTSILTIATAAASTFMSTQWSMGSHEAKINSLEESLVHHRTDMNIHVDKARQLEQERRMSRVEYMVESIKEDVEEVKDALKKK